MEDLRYRPCIELGHGRGSIGPHLCLTMRDWAASADLDHDGRLNEFEFSKFATNIGLHITSQEKGELFRHFDMNKDEHIDSSEFASGLLLDLSQARPETVFHVW